MYEANNRHSQCLPIQADSTDTRVSLVRRLWLRAFPLGFRAEFVQMLGLAWPSILTTLMQFFLQTTSFIMCGHMSKQDLDGVALANSLINVAGLSIGVGMSTACDTLFSQTYGSRNRRRIGLYLQRSFLLMNCALLLLACLHLNVRPLLLLMRQLPEIAERAALYMRLFLPGLFFHFNFLVLSRYLQNQSRMYPPMVAAFCGNLFNASGQYVAIHVLGYNYLASAVIQAASLALMFALTLGYILASGIYRETWDGWKIDSLRDWGEFVRLSVPGVFLIALEEWGFEVATIVAGTMGEVQLGAQSIIFQLESISYMIPFGMSVAVNIRVGQQLGGMQPAGAAQSFRVGLLMTVATALLTCNMFVFLRDWLPRMFTSDREIVSTASQVIPLLGLFQLFDGISAVSCGAIRGTGRQVEGAVLLFIGYYAIGLPIGVPLALLTPLRVTGTWVGLLVGIAAEAAAFCCLVMRFDWLREAEKAQERAYGRQDPSRCRCDLRRRRRKAFCGCCAVPEVLIGETIVDDDDDDNNNKSSDELPASETESERSPLLAGRDGGGGGGSGGYGSAGGLRPEADDIAFYSDPETFCSGGDLQQEQQQTSLQATATAEGAIADVAVAGNPRRGRHRSGRRQRRPLPSPHGGTFTTMSGVVYYTGRFYSSSRLMLHLPDDAEEAAIGINGNEEGEGDRRDVRRLLAKRLALLLALAAALAGSVALMLFLDTWLGTAVPMSNVTVPAMNSVA